jgi:small subunit ribosomal protein S21
MGKLLRKSSVRNFNKEVPLKDFQPLEVRVHNNDVEKAIKILKKKMQKDGIFRKIKEKRSYEKPSDKKRRKRRENARKFGKK